MAIGAWSGPLAPAFAADAAGASPAAKPAAEAPHSSALDAPMLYQILIGEIEARRGDAAAGFEVLLDAARRTKDESLFRRCVDMALQGRAGERALTAVRAWRQSLPESLDAIRLQLQILSALNQVNEIAEPLRTLIGRTPKGEQGALIASLPRFFDRAADKRSVIAMLEPVLQPYAAAPATRTAARIALARLWSLAGDAPRALQLTAQAHADEPSAIGPALLALELLPRLPAAERIVQGHLKSPQVEPAFRLAWSRALMQAQRLGEAVAQVELVTVAQPTLAPPFLTLGAMQLDLRQTAKAEAALKRYVELAQEAAQAAPTAARPNDDEDDDDEPAARGADAGLVQAWLLLAQAAEQRGDEAAAEAYLARVDSPQRALEVQSRRAAIMARRGQVDEARELIRRVPERTGDDARAKLVAEAHLLRDLKRWQPAMDLLAQGAQRWPKDTDLLYEQAMMAEKLNRLDDMERLLRQVIELKPDHPHAYNALGYSLADRGLRLQEARALIVKALELAPGDPFITDSLGWVEFRLGRLDEALRLLRQAYTARPDTEIAAHLGEVLWVKGQRDEARRIWREGRGRDEANDVLRETLARLKPDL